MIERTYSEPEPTRKVDAVTREFLLIDGVRHVRTTRFYADAATGEPLGVRKTDTPMPPMIRWAAEEGIDQ